MEIDNHDSGNDSADVHSALEALTRRLDVIADENRQLRDEIAQLRDARAERTDAERPGAELADAVFEAALSRRSFFATAAVVAGGAAGGAALLARPAAAAAGGNMILGQLNSTVSQTTTLTTSTLPAAGIFEAAFLGTNNGTVGTGVSGYGNSYGLTGFTAFGTAVWGKSSGDATELNAFATGVAGYIDNPLGLLARGVIGSAHGPTQTGVIGESDEGTGVQGTSQTGQGVVGESQLGTGGAFAGKLAGVQGKSATGTAGVFSGGFADLSLGGLRTTPPTTDITFHYWGDVVVEAQGSGGALWVCVTSGTPGTWRRVQAPNTVGALTLLAAPVRVYDSRSGRAPAGIGPKSPLAVDVDRPISCKPAGVAGLSSIPSSATAVLITLTAVNQTGSGYLAVRATGSAYAGTSNMNWSSAGQTVGNQLTTACGAGPNITLRLGGAPGNTANVIVDVVGFYR